MKDIIKMKADQERVKTLLTDTVTLLCKNGLFFSQQLKVQGLLGITVDDNEVFIVHIDEIYADGLASNPASPHSTADVSGSTAENSISNCSKLKEAPVSKTNPSSTVSLSAKRKRKDRSSVSSPLGVHGGKDDSSCVIDELNEPQSKCFISDSQSEIPYPETSSNADQPKEEKNDQTLEESVNSFVIKEEKDEDCTILDNDTLVPDQKVLSDSPELLQQLFNQFVPGGSEDFDGLMADGGAVQLQTISECTGMKAAKQHLLTNNDALNTTISDAVNIWNASSAGRQWFASHALSSSENLNDSLVNNHNDKSDVYVVPNLWLPARRTVMSARKKRYECTLDGCGRQYQNTFDLYRHQRQKHNVPPEFYQQGKKQTFGIREIDTS